jgi:hypothetical protein
VPWAFDQFANGYSYDSVITVPDLYQNPDAPLPDVREQIYCRCPLTGAPMFAYSGYKAEGGGGGTWARPGTTKPLPIKLAGQWYRSREEAERSRQIVEKQLVELRGKLSKKLDNAEELRVLADKLTALFSWLGENSKGVAADIKAHLEEHAKLNPNRTQLVLNWSKRAQELIDAAQYSVSRNGAILKKACDDFIERVLSSSFEGAAQDRAMEAIDRLEAKIKAGSKEEADLAEIIDLLFAVREHVWFACGDTRS